MQRLNLTFFGAAEPVDWDAVYREMLPAVYNYFRYRVGHDQVAEDLTATTFEKAWRARNRYRRDRAGFATWVFTIARNVAIDHFRQERAHVPLEQISQTPGDFVVDDLVLTRNDHHRLAQLLAQLTERELVALKYGSGLTNRAIAALVNMSESNVGTTLHRVVTRLRSQWED